MLLLRSSSLDSGMAKSTMYRYLAARSSIRRMSFNGPGAVDAGRGSTTLSVDSLRVVKRGQESLKGMQDNKP